MGNIPKGYKQTEVGVIPEDWEVKSLNTISSSVASGKSKNKSETGIFTVFGSTGIIGFNSSYDYEGQKILVARVGANAGTTNIVDGKYCVSDNTLIVDLKKDTDFLFVFYFLKHSNLNKLIFGSGQPLITGSQLKDLNISLPPTKAEQTAIAAALSDADALIISLEKLIAKKRNIKQGTMQELLTGKKRLPGFSGEWEVKKLGEIAPLQRGFDLPTTQLQSGKYPVVYSNGIENFHSEYRAKAPGVVTGRSGTIGKVTYVEEHYWPHNTSLWVTDFKESYPLFIYYLYIHIKLERFGTGSGVPTLNRNDVHDFKVAIPNRAEQTAIAQILSDMDAEIEKLEQKLAKYRMIKQGMMQELLTGKTRLV